MLSILFLSVLTGWIFLSATDPLGIGLTTDSIEYIWSAENLRNGIGLGRLTGSGVFKPMTHWPPFYSLVITLFTGFGLDGYTAARLIGGIALILFVWLCFIVARKMSSITAALVGCAILLLSPTTWVVFLFALTEPLYMVLFLAAVLCFSRLISGGKTIWLYLAASFISLAILTRYVGVVLIPVVLLPYLVLNWKNWKKSMLHSAGFTVVAILPILSWVLYNQFRYQNATNRYLAVNPIPPGDYQKLAYTLYQAVEPVEVMLQVGWWKLAAILLLAAAGILLYLRQSKNRPAQAATTASPVIRFLVLLNLANILFYPVMLFLSRLLFDAMIDIFRERMIYPFYLSAVFLAIYLANLTWQRVSRKSVPGVMLLAVVFALLGVTFLQGFSQQIPLMIRKSQKDGIGISRLRMEPSQIASAFKGLPQADTVFSDNIEAFYLVSGVPTFQIVSSDIVDFAQLIESNRGKHAYYIIQRTRNFAGRLLDTYPELSLVYSGNDGRILEQLP